MPNSLNNRQAIESLFLSLRIAAVSASIATVLGMFAGLALQRFGRFRGRFLLTGMITAPLVMPEVITGPVAIIAVYISGRFHRLAGGARRHNGDHRAHHVFRGVCRRGDTGPARGIG